MPGILDMFKTKPAAPPQNQQQQQMPPLNNPDGNKDPNKLQDGGDFSQDPASKKAKSPLDLYAKLFDTPSEDGTKKPPVFALDAAMLKDVSSKLSFTEFMTPELTEALKSGDPAAQKQAFDALGQSVYTTAMQHLSGLTDKFVDLRMSHDRESLGSHVKDVLTKDKLASLASDNPIVQEQIDGIGARLRTKFPDKSPDWVTEQTKAYFIHVATALDPSLGKKSRSSIEQGQEEDANVDWASWMAADKQAQT